MHSEKVSYQSSLPRNKINNMDQNLQMCPFEPAEESQESLCFLRGLLELMMEAKNINISYIFDVKSHVIAKCGNCSEEIAGRLKNNIL